MSARIDHYFVYLQTEAEEEVLPHRILCNGAGVLSHSGFGM